jgi:3alpha(or 20beta)-hydroxysteroid dehydrogenase
LYRQFSGRGLSRDAPAGGGSEEIGVATVLQTAEMHRLDGKIALVTGAARGTGAAIARKFVDEGARVVVVDVLEERGRAVVEDLGDAARFELLDVTDEHAWEEVVAGVDASAGALDILVNNAAVLHLATIDATATDAFERVMRVNVLGPFLGIRACLPLLRASGAGSIVNVGSIDSVQGAALTGAYTASKFALRGLTKVVALENRKRGVRANIVCPMLGNPEMHPEVVGTNSGPIAVGKGAPPDLSVIAEAVCYFASDESRFATGTELVLDGGHSAGLALDLPDSWFDPNLRSTPDRADPTNLPKNR